MRETSTPVDILDDRNLGDGEVAQWILPLIFPELNARTLQEKGDQHLLQDNVARLAGNLQAVASNVTAYSEALQTQWRAIAALARGQGQATRDLRELRALVESVIEGVADVAREQAAVRGVVQEGLKAMSGTTEALGQGQRNLQAEVEKVMEAARQALAALTATAAEQTAVHETVRRVMDAVTGVATRQTALGEAVQAHEQASAALAGRQEQLATDVRRVHELTQTVVGGIGDVVREQAATRGAMQESARVMGAAAEAIGQGQRNLQAEVQNMVETTRQAVTGLTATAAEQTATHETVRRMSEELTAIAAGQSAVHETVRQVREELTGVAVHQTALQEAVQTLQQGNAAAAAALTGRQEQLAGDVRQLHELTRTVAGGVAEAAREQAALRGIMQDGAKAVTATIETVQQGQRTLRTELEKITDTAQQTIAALTAAATEQTAVHEMVRRVMDEVTGVGARQTALHETVQAHGQALTGAAAEQAAVHETVRQVREELTGVAVHQTALQEAVQTLQQAAAALTGRQEQLTGDVRRLQELIQTVAGGVADVVREQAVVRGVLQDGAKVVHATTEALQHGQRALGTEMEKLADATRQTMAAVTATVAEQSAGQEITRRMIGEVASAAMAALAAGHGPLAGTLPPSQGSAQTVADLGPLATRTPEPTADSEAPQRLSAARAITHGEQIRYETGPDRDNLGFWTNASDWAEWEIEVKRPGRFRVTAQIAAVAPARFQVVFADQKLEGNAPNTGDYGRFQQVELGSVELTSSGKTRVAVRPIPEGWQPMNLQALDLTPLT